MFFLDVSGHPCSRGQLVIEVFLTLAMRTNRSETGSFGELEMESTHLLIGTIVRLFGHD
jgi:hypothetical protein